MKFSDQLRRAVEESGLTRYRIAQLTEIDESALAKFCSGQRGLSLDSIDRLVAVLKLQLTTKTKVK